MRCNGIEATRAACLEGQLAPVGYPDVGGGLGALAEAEVPPTQHILQDILAMRVVLLKEREGEELGGCS